MRRLANEAVDAGLLSPDLAAGIARVKGVNPGSSGRAAVTVLLDGRPPGDARGMDVGTDGVARFDRSGMIRLIVVAARQRHALRLSSSDPGLRAYVFTFGP